MNYKFLVFV